MCALYVASMAMMHVHRPMLTLSKKVAENREEAKFRDRLALWSLFRPPPPLENRCRRRSRYAKDVGGRCGGGVGVIGANS